MLSARPSCRSCTLNLNDLNWTKHDGLHLHHDSTIPRPPMHLRLGHQRSGSDRRVLLDLSNYVMAFSIVAASTPRSMIPRPPMALSPMSINASGQITGCFAAAVDRWFGFLYSGGSYTTFDHPSISHQTAPYSTTAVSIDNLGQITGYYLDGGYRLVLSTTTAITVFFIAAAPTPRSKVLGPPSAPFPTASTRLARSQVITRRHRLMAFSIAAAPTPPSTIPWPPAAPFREHQDHLGQIVGYYDDVSGRRWLSL